MKKNDAHTVIQPNQSQDQPIGLGEYWSQGVYISWRCQASHYLYL